MLDKNKKVLEVISLLDECPKIRATIPCNLSTFKKMLVLMPEDDLEKLHGALTLEKSLNEKDG